MANIAPCPQMINSVRNQNLSWSTILGEFIDNAFDASATQIRISFNKKRLEIIDDGDGCADVLGMVTLGARQDHSGTELGQYGIGAKDAMISAADAVIVRSVHKGMASVIGLNWIHLSKQQAWDIDDPTTEPTSDRNGTRIILDGTRMERIGDHEKLIQKLSEIYSPAIQSGKQIVLQFAANKPPRTVPQFDIPALEHRVDADLNVDGKTAKITMGLIPSGHPVRQSGITISYGYRVIESGARLGLGDKPTPRLCGWLSLGREWSLTKNKTSLSSDTANLGAAIANACAATIAIAAEEGQDVLFDGVANAINSAINAIAADNPEKDAKAKRKPRSVANDSAKPTGNGGKHKRAEVIQSGKTFSSIGTTLSKFHKIKIGWQEQGPDGPACSFNNPVLYLNRDIPELARNINNPAVLTVHAVYAAATWFATDEGPQRTLWDLTDCKTIFERMAKIAGILLTHLQTGTQVNPVPSSKASPANQDMVIAN